MNKDDIAIIIPIIRQILPSTIAKDIISVQPMGHLRDPEPMELGTYELNSREVWYWVKPESAPLLDFVDLRNTMEYWNEVETWCIETFGSRNMWADPDDPGRWSASDRKYYFRYESDRTMFILKWC